MPRRRPTSTGRNPGRHALERAVEGVLTGPTGRVATATARPRPVPVDPAKLAAPHAPVGAVPRPRVDALLDDAPGPLCIVSAPAGYGRTTALATWARSSGRPCAWLTLDPRDDDPRHLRAHLRAALDALPPASSGTLVLDDAHRVSAPEALEVLRTIAVAPPHGVRVVASLRTPPGRGPAVPGAARDDATVGPGLGADDLAFTAAETGLALNGEHDLGLDDRRLAAACAVAGGWPAGVALVADALAGAPGWRTFSESLDAATVAIARRLEADVLAESDDALRAFLLRTAILRRPDPDACAAVLAGDGSAELLARARRAGLLAATPDGGLVHRGPFRTALRTALAVREPELVPELHRRASRWFEARGAAGPAAEHAAAAGDLLRAAAISSAHVAALGASDAVWATGESAARRALDDDREADATVRGAAEAALALALWRAGDDVAVRALLEPRVGGTVHPAARCWSLSLLALAVAPADPGRAEALARHARRISRRPDATWLEPVLAHQALADALRSGGDLGGAHVALDEAAARTAGVSDSPHHGMTRLLRAELALATDDADAARVALGPTDPVGVPASRLRAARLAAG